MWRIRYDEPSTNYKTEYWNGEIFLDDVLEEIIEAVTKKDVCPCDIIIQNLDGFYDETIENEDDREEMYTVETFLYCIENVDNGYVNPDVEQDVLDLIEKVKNIPEVKEMLEKY